MTELKGKSESPEITRKYMIAWEQNDQHYCDFIETISLDQAEKTLTQIQEQGHIHQDYKSKDYYISFNYFKIITSTDQITGNLPKLYSKRQEAAAHLDAIKLRGRIEMVSSTEFKRARRDIDTLVNQLDATHRKIAQLEAQLEAPVRANATPRKKRKATREKA